MTTQDPLVKLDKLAKRSIASDPKLLRLLNPFFDNSDGTNQFINKCLSELKTRRMLLRVEWYVELATLIRTSKDKRPALPIIFLMAMAESLARSLLSGVDKRAQSIVVIGKFFEKISDEDKLFLRQKIRRAYLKPKTPKLRFSSIIKLLWNVRNDAVHGIDFWSFDLPDSDVGRLTNGWWRPKKKQRRGRRGTGKPIKETLDVNLQYEELQAVFIRTALNNIRSAF